MVRRAPSTDKGDAMKTIQRPQPGEYADYGIVYVNEVPDGGQVLQMMQDNLTVIDDLVRSFPDERLTTPHAPGEWTIQEILVHIIDVERVFAYRGLRFARNDQTNLPGFEHNDYVASSSANKRIIDDILAEYRAVRMASITLFDNLTDEALAYVGRANNTPTTARAMAYFIAGHEQHHIHSIRENYG
ncbi:MAG: DNA damage-inducible protein DinB [Anaerolineaceae bacterium]|nr:DNA damage-inducible protein DinB [Anaerolineaceae bacterium]